MLTACIVRTLEQTDPAFADRFLQVLTDAQNAHVDSERKGDIQTTEILAWTRELLTGWNFISGQGNAFLKDFLKDE